MVPRPPGYQKNIKKPINYLINSINYFPRDFPINPLKGPYGALWELPEAYDQRTR